MPLTSTHTGSVLPSGRVRVSERYWPPTSVHPMKSSPSLRTYTIPIAILRPSSRSTPSEYSIRAGRTHVGIELQVAFGIHDRNDPRIAAGRRIETSRRDGGLTGMEWSELSGHHTLVESSVADAEQCPAVRTELRGRAEARRHDVPGVQRTQTADDDPGLVAVGVERAQILTDGAGYGRTARRR